MGKKDESEEDEIYRMGLEEQSLAEDTGIGFCYKCGGVMEFDSFGSTLICSSCGHEVSLENYGFEGYEDYEFISYPRQEEVDPDYKPDDTDFDE